MIARQQISIARIAEIKRIWQAGLSTAQMAARCDPKIFGGKHPTRHSIIGYYDRYPDEFVNYRLLPAHTNASRSNKKRKPTEPKRIPYAGKSDGRQHNRIPKRRQKNVAENDPDYEPPARIAREDRAPVATRTDPDFAVNQERRYRVEQMMLDREPIIQNHKAKIHKISLARIGGR